MPRIRICQGFLVPIALPNGDLLELAGGEYVPDELLTPTIAKNLIDKGYGKWDGAPEPHRSEIVLLDPGSDGFNIDRGIGAFKQELAGFDKGQRGGRQIIEAPKAPERSGADLWEERKRTARAQMLEVSTALGVGPFALPREIAGKLTISEATDLARSIDSAAPEFTNHTDAVNWLTKDLPKAPA